jgi:hypothetical protein
MLLQFVELCRSYLDLSPPVSSDIYIYIAVTAFVLVIKLRIIRWVGRVERKGR